MPKSREILEDTSFSGKGYGKIRGHWPEVSGKIGGEKHALDPTIRESLVTLMRALGRE